MQKIADNYIQSYIEPDIAVCYGCGYKSENGHHVQTVWDGTVGRSRFTPKPEQIGYPNMVYGGTLASIIDCHGIGTAVAALYDAEGRAADTKPNIYCVTANLNVNYLAPTPIGYELQREAHIKAIKGKKVIVAITVAVDEQVTVSAELIAIRVDKFNLD